MLWDCWAAEHEFCDSCVCNLILPQLLNLLHESELSRGLLAALDHCLLALFWFESCLVRFLYLPNARKISSRVWRPSKGLLEPQNWGRRRPIDREYPWQRRRKGAAVLNWARQRHGNVNGGLNHDRSSSATSKKLFSAKWSSTVEGRRPRRWNFHQTWTSDLPQAVDRWPRNSHRAGIRKICFAVDLVDVTVIFLGLILLASKTKWGVRGSSPGKIFLLRWLKSHFFNSECLESGMTRNQKMVKTSPLHCDLSSRRSVCRWNIKSVNHRMITVR